jgi:hypothetical protein
MVHKYHYGQLYGKGSQRDHMVTFISRVKDYVLGMQSSNSGAVGETHEIVIFNCTVYATIKNPHLSLGKKFLFFGSTSYSSNSESEKYAKEYEQRAGHPGYPYYIQLSFPIQDIVNLSYDTLVAMSRHSNNNFGEIHAMIFSFKFKGTRTRRLFSSSMRMTLSSSVAQGYSGGPNWDKFSPETLWHFRNFYGKPEMKISPEALLSGWEEQSGQDSNYIERITGIKALAA